MWCYYFAIQPSSVLDIDDDLVNKSRAGLVRIESRFLGFLLPLWLSPSRVPRSARG
jgi:hypothetical protein